MISAELTIAAPKGPMQAYVSRRDDRTAMSMRLDTLRRDSGTVGLFGLSPRAAALLVVAG